MTQFKCFVKSMYTFAYNMKYILFSNKQAYVVNKSKFIYTVFKILNRK